MRLYHGSNIRITNVNLAKSEPHKDFGKGFYLTADYSRAVAMARRKVAIDGGNATVSPFIFNRLHCPGHIKIKEFKGHSAEWALFIIENRDKSSNYTHDYDIVIGPVADARVDDILSDYKQKFGAGYDKADNLRQLAKKLVFPGKVYIQYCFCTPAGVLQLIAD